MTIVDLEGGLLRGLVSTPGGTLESSSGSSSSSGVRAEKGL